MLTYYQNCAIIQPLEKMMTQETRDVLYNKKAEELNKDEIELIEQLIAKKWAGNNVWIATIFGTVLGILLPLITLNPSSIAEFQVIAPVMTGMGAFSSLFISSAIYAKYPSLSTMPIVLSTTSRIW